MERTVSVELGGRTLSLQNGKIARLAGGSAANPPEGSPGLGHLPAQSTSHHRAMTAKGR